MCPKPQRLVSLLSTGAARTHLYKQCFTLPGRRYKIPNCSHNLKKLIYSLLNVMYKLLNSLITSIYRFKATVRHEGHPTKF